MGWLIAGIVFFIVIFFGIINVLEDTDEEKQEMIEGVKGFNLHNPVEYEQKKINEE
jgi:hypothetical protein